jgi:hypothetical protein
MALRAGLRAVFDSPDRILHTDSIAEIDSLIEFLQSGASWRQSSTGL